MTSADLAGMPHKVDAGDHVCWIVSDALAYTSAARVALADGVAHHEKVVAFGPAASGDLHALTGAVATTADPYTDVLAGRRLDPDAMFTMFREQADQARAEGFTGLRVIADMDWLLPADPSTDSIVDFELRLDRVVHEVGATVICAYRTRSFEQSVLSAALAVHPSSSGAEQPPFRLYTQDATTWLLAGEIDIGSIEAFETAARTVASSNTPVLDVAALEFIDIAGMRALAQASIASTRPLLLQNTSQSLRRAWHAAGFDKSTYNLVLK